MVRQSWIDTGDTVSVVRQCVLAGVSRATIYAQQKPRPIDESDLLFSRLIDEEYTRHPFYGSRKMAVFLKVAGHTVNRKRVQGLMRNMGLVGMAPGPNTSRPHPEHKVYPYLLRGVFVVRPDQVWSTDITYIRLARGFAYLAAVIDWYSRRVLSWRISNSMEAEFCVDCLEEALVAYVIYVDTIWKLTRNFSMLLNLYAKSKMFGKTTSCQTISTEYVHHLICPSQE